MNKVNRATLPCKHFKEWQENQSPIGSGYRWMETFTECESPDMDNDTYDKLDWDRDCNPKCKFYAPVPVLVCDKHGEYYDFCTNCYEGQ